MAEPELRIAELQAENERLLSSNVALTEMLIKCIGSGNLPVAIEHQARELLAK